MRCRFHLRTVRPRYLARRGATSMFKCWVEDGPLAAIVHVRGDVDLLTAPEFRACVHTTASSAANNGGMIVDLSELEYIDASGLLTLEEGRQLCRQQSRELVLVAPPPHVERILEMLKLTELLPVLTSAEALSVRAPFNGEQLDKSGNGAQQPVPGREPHGELDPEQRGRTASDE
jgi:anti-sigma B factor antagonist